MDRMAAAEARLAAALDRLDAATQTLPGTNMVDAEVHEALVGEYDRLNCDIDQVALAGNLLRRGGFRAFQAARRVADLALVGIRRLGGADPGRTAARRGGVLPPYGKARHRH